jgi:hypothetical protein
MTRRPQSLRTGRVDPVEIQKRAERLARSVGEIQVALGRAEEKIEADARQRIEMLRKGASRAWRSARCPVEPGLVWPPCDAKRTHGRRGQQPVRAAPHGETG